GPGRSRRPGRRGGPRPGGGRGHGGPGRRGGEHGPGSSPPGERVALTGASGPGGPPPHRRHPTGDRVDRGGGARGHHLAVDRSAHRRRHRRRRRIMTALSHSSPAGSVDEWAGTPVGYRRTAVTVTNDTLADPASALASQGYRLALVAAHDDGDALRAVYLYTAAAPDRRVELHLPIDLADPVVPSLAALSFPAGRFEREMHDLYGIIPRDHPLPRRLVRHDHWPRGWYPMRRDAGPPPEFGEEQPFPFLTVEGPGVYEIPVGPIHAGLIEPGHFRFSVVGETILKLKARLWYVHRGVERLFAGRTVDGGIPLAERISGDTAVGHTLAYCRAVEDALGIEVPVAALRARALLLELERIYNHIGDLGALCNDVGHGILNSHALRIRERLLRLNAEVTGHRLLRGGVRVGGSALRRVPEVSQVDAIAADIAELVDLALGNTLVAERFTDTAILSPAQARDLGT